MITEEQLEAALAVLTDEEAAAEVNLTVLRAENARDLVMDRLFITYNEGSIEMRKARARCHPDYQDANEQYIEAYGALQQYRQRIKGAEAVKDVFQTQSANARQSEWIR